MLASHQAWSLMCKIPALGVRKKVFALSHNKLWVFEKQKKHLMMFFPLLVFRLRVSSSLHEGSAVV